MRDLGDDFTEQIAQARSYAPVKIPRVDARPDFVRVSDRRVVGVDVFIEHVESARELGDALTELAQGTTFELGTVTSRGTSLYPPPMNIPLTDPVDHWPCRFMARDPEASVTDASIIELLTVISGRYRWMHVEKLQRFEGAEGFTKAQGER